MGLPGAFGIELCPAKLTLRHKHLLVERQIHIISIIAHFASFVKHFIVAFQILSAIPAPKPKPIPLVEATPALCMEKKVWTAGKD
jgi:hypothetical protein